MIKEHMNFDLHGHIRVFEEANPSNILYEADNVIVNGVKYLFARMLGDLGRGDSSIDKPKYGVWGLAVGAGGTGIDWPPTNQPDALPTQTGLLSPILRKRLSFVRYVDSNLNPITGYSNIIDFQTILNATTDNISTPIRELGLIAGGSVNANTDMGNPSTPFFDPTSPNVVDSAVLVNYKTLPPLSLPAGINFCFSWILTA
jgi:hypothetical protein